MKKALLIILFLSSLKFWTQTNPHQVINSAGSDRQLGSSNIYITDNVGEPFTDPLVSSNNLWLLTQGFLQPFGINNSKATAAISGVTCADKDDGIISIAFSTVNQNHNEVYFWSPATGCPNNDCGNSNTIKNIKAGTYSVMIVSTYTNAAGKVKTDTLKQNNLVVNDSKEICKIKIFTAFTPNNDNINDKWVIENINEFPKNKVTIFNRWGNQVFETNGYDNEAKAWPTSKELNNLVASTYFYIIDLGDGTKPYKGWVELIKQ